MNDLKNSDMPINGVLQKVDEVAISEGGLTKREYFAGLAMQGLMANMAKTPPYQKYVVKRSVEMADLLLAELEK